MVEELRSLGSSNMLVVCGGVIPPQDYEDLYSAGVSAVYGPGTNIAVAARDLLTVIEKNLATQKEREAV